MLYFALNNPILTQITHVKIICCNVVHYFLKFVLKIPPFIKKAPIVNKLNSVLIVLVVIIFYVYLKKSLHQVSSQQN